MEKHRLTRSETALNITSMAVGLLGVVGSVLAQNNGVSITESHVLTVVPATNAILGIIQAARCFPHALKLNTIENNDERKSLFGKAFNEMGLAFLNATSGILCGFAGGLGF